MVDIRPYSENDYSELLPFLQNFNPLISENTWKHLLSYSWKNEAGFRGVIMKTKSGIVGFMSYIIHSDNYQSPFLTYCNLSSWVVLPEHRSQSMKLLSKAFDLKNVVILNLSPHVNTRPVFKALRFEMLAESEYRFNPFKMKKAFLGKQKNAEIRCRKITTAEENTGLTEQQKTMMKDHAIYPNVNFYLLSIRTKHRTAQLVLAFNEKKILLTGIRERVKELPYTIFGKAKLAELLYVDLPELLSAHVSEIMLALLNQMNFRSINVGENFIENESLQPDGFVKNKKDCPWFYYTEQSISRSRIHLLYTEKVLLNF